MKLALTPVPALPTEDINLIVIASPALTDKVLPDVHVFDVLSIAQVGSLPDVIAVPFLTKATLRLLPLPGALVKETVKLLIVHEYGNTTSALAIALIKLGCPVPTAR